MDPQRANVIRKAFQLVATKSYGLQEVLHRITVLGLTTRKGRPLTKQTLSRLLRNQIYAGWVVSGENKVKGLHEPLVSQSLFDSVQNALNGKGGPPIVHKKVNSEFPLKGFVLCAGCGKKLTAGFVKGRSDKYPRYWCWNPKCSTKVSASRDEIERTFVSILAMMVPTQELINRLPEIAKTYWASRLERTSLERRTLTTRLADTRTLNQKVLLQKVNGELSAEDFAILKDNVAQQQIELEAQQIALDAENATMQSLLEETQNNIVDLVKAWKTGDTQRRRELYTREGKSVTSLTDLPFPLANLAAMHGIARIEVNKWNTYKFATDHYNLRTGSSPGHSQALLQAGLWHDLPRQGQGSIESHTPHFRTARRSGTPPAALQNLLRD